MGPRPASAREHLLWGQFEQHTVSTHEHLPEHHGMASLWHNTFRSAGRLFNHHVHIRSPRHGANVCKKLWLDEPYWGGDSVDIPMLTAMVRKHVWTRARKLFHTWLASRIGGYR